MKRICFVGYDLTKCGGLGRVITSLANSLCENEEKYEIHMVTVCNSQGNDFFFRLDERIKKFIISVDFNFRFRKIIFAAFKKLKDYIIKNNIDIIYIADFTIPPIVMMIKPFIKCKIIFADHGTLSNQLEHKKATAFRFIGKVISDKIVVLTKQNAKDYQKYFKVKPNKIEVIYNWIDEEVLENVRPYNVDSKVIMSSGRFTEEKGVDMVPCIAKQVFSKHPDWQWHIYGDGPLMDSVKEEIVENNLQKNVIFKGFTSTMYDKYRNAGIFTLTSYREGLSLVLMEAKANRIPLVSFNCIAGPSEIITNGVDGYLIPCYNKEEMAQKICKLIESPELRANFSHHLKDDLNKFSRAKILKQWFELIDNI